MNLKKLRTLTPIAVIVVFAVGFATTGGMGTLSAFGWQAISVICPLGALSTMIATRTVLPRELVSLAIAVVMILLLGRAFCGWICPVPTVSKLRDAFQSRKAARRNEEDAARKAEEAKQESERRVQAFKDAGGGNDDIQLTEKDRQILARSMAGCSHKRPPLDSRHFVLGGALLSAAIFGFPVFCLVCPVGLTFATVFLLMQAFGSGDVTWALVVVPLVLVLEVVVFRKWCHTLCPLGALMSLVGKGNKTVQPTADPDVCLESSRGVACGRCAQACGEGINPRYPELGTGRNECIRCRSCIDACPTHAITMPFLPKRTEEDRSAPPGTDRTDRVVDSA
jgi:ferredoxin-type protein NapH